jgi:plasmid stabilization system protein ParE
MKLTWSPIAQREFAEAVEYLEEKNAKAAESWRDDVHSMLGMIECYPEIGHRHRIELTGEFREVIVGRYRFIYCHTPGELSMRRVLHVRRDYDPMRIREGVPRGFPAFASG